MKYVMLMSCIILSLCYAMMVKMPHSNNDNEMINNNLGPHQQQHKINGSNNHYDVNTKENKFNNKEVRSLVNILFTIMLKIYQVIMQDIMQCIDISNDYIELSITAAISIITNAAQINTSENILNINKNNNATTSNKITNIKTLKIIIQRMIFLMQPQMQKIITVVAMQKMKILQFQ